MADELRDLRRGKKIPAKEIVAAVQKKYPGFDKTVLSKVDNGNRYGVTLRRDVVDALIGEFAPEAREAVKWRRDGRHRLTHRIQARLEENVYSELQQALRRDGWETTQDWLTDMVKTYLQNEKEQNND